MKFLIHIQSGSELITYEALSLAFVLASFEHLVTLYFSHDSIEVLTDPTSRLYGMVQSLQLYDIEKAYLSQKFDKTRLDDKILARIQTLSSTQLLDDQLFDSVLYF